MRFVCIIDFVVNLLVYAVKLVVEQFVDFGKLAVSSRWKYLFFFLLEIPKLLGVERFHSDAFLLLLYERCIRFDHVRRLFVFVSRLLTINHLRYDSLGVGIRLVFIRWRRTIVDAIVLSNPSLETQI